MVLNRLSEAGGRGAGGFVGGIANNPGIILILVALGGLLIFRDKISEGFASIGEGIGNFELPGISLPDITFPTFEFPEITFPSFDFDFPDITLPDITTTITSGFEGITQGFEKTIADLQNQINLFKQGTIQVQESPFDDTPIITSPGIGNCKCGTLSIIQDAQGIVTETCVKCEEPSQQSGGFLSDTIETTVTLGPTDEETESVFSQIMEKVISMIPTSQEFFGGGPSFVGGSIFENPIDTFSEVLKFFPGLSASQAADFLEETGGKLLPSQVDFFDADIKNIVANIGGENVQVQTVFSSDLQTEAIKAACTTCELFNLNCEQCRAGMA